MKRLALDTETTGRDFNHGAQPFFVTLCQENDDPIFFEWSVDPMTRQVQAPKADLRDLWELIESADELVLQNSKFDVRALQTLYGPTMTFPWGKIRDTLLAAHLLASNSQKNLTVLAATYIGVNLYPLEEALIETCKAARRLVQSQKRQPGSPLSAWRIAEEGDPMLPSAAKETYKNDYWLPRAVYQAAHAYAQTEQGQQRLADKAAADELRTIKRVKKWVPEWWEDFLDPTSEYASWNTALQEYSNGDSWVTVRLWPVMWSKIQARRLDKIYMRRLQVLPVAYDMEYRGVTIHRGRLNELKEQYTEESQVAGQICLNVAEQMQCELTLPKNGANASMRKLLFGQFRLPVTGDSEYTHEDGSSNKRIGDGSRQKKKKSTLPSLDKAHIEMYLDLLEDRNLVREYGIDRAGLAKAFLRNLQYKRKRDTSLQYLAGYERFWRPYFDTDEKRANVLQWAEHLSEFDDWFVLFPNLNPTGSDTLRWTSNNPNEQNISKSGMFEGDKKTLRYCFGPSIGREWWSLDAKNIELRIPAYEAGEEEMIALFERPDDPPYYGSNHLLIAHTLHPEKWAALAKEVGEENAGKEFKKRYAATWYQWTKNGNFAVQYGAVNKADGTGTADRAYHVKGGQTLIEARFGKMKSLNQRCIQFAAKYGYIETLPDKSVDPKRGYPLLCTRSEHGKILPTVPLNYRVQGTAMWWTMQAMIRVQAQLDEWRRYNGFDGRIVMQVHDELVLDFPKSKVSPLDVAGQKYTAANHEDRLQSNLWRIRVIQGLMEKCGDDLGVPTPVGCEYHDSSWAEGVTL